MKLKEGIKKYWRGILGWIVVLVAVFFILAFAPLGFLFRESFIVNIERVIAIFLSAFLILYFLKK